MILVLLLLFILGLAIGSFLNVVIYRTIHDESPAEGRSKCPHCHKQIAWYDNIPLISYLVLRGKCRHCKKSISWSYPVIELLTGLLFVWWYAGGFLLLQIFQLQDFPLVIIQPIFWLLVGMLLVIIFFTDLLYMVIPDYAVGLLLGLVVLYRVALVLSGVMQVTDLVWSVLGMVGVGGFFFSLWFVTKGKGMGFGDVKFVFPMTLLVGWPAVMVTVLSSFILGGIVGGVLLLLKKKHLKQTVPFGPFLVLGTVLSLLYGDTIIHWYLALL